MRKQFFFQSHGSQFAFSGIDAALHGTRQVVFVLLPYLFGEGAGGAINGPHSSESLEINSY